jgi:hypothetical protein
MSDNQEHTFAAGKESAGVADKSSNDNQPNNTNGNNDRSGQLQALRALHKMDKKQRRESDSNASVRGLGSVPDNGISGESEGTGKFGGIAFAEGGTGGAVGGFRGKQEIRNSPPKGSGKVPVQEKRDISITLSAYNVQLKKAADKEYFKLREEFSHSLVKLESLDTRDVVNIVLSIRV